MNVPAIVTAIFLCACGRPRTAAEPDAGALPNTDATDATATDIDGARPLDPLLDPPTPITPATDVRVATTPAFTYRLASGTDGARVEVCADRACASIIATANAVGSIATLGVPLAPGRWFYRLYGRAGTTTGTRPSACRPFVLATRAWNIPVPFLDLDDDGRSDLVVGAPGDTLGTGSYIASYLGTASGDFRAAGSVYRISGFPYVNIGSVLAPLGDFDGDGYGDVVMAGGMPGGNPNGRGTFVLFGGPNGLDVSRIASLGGVYDETVSGIGDINGDGHEDFAWGDQLHSTVNIFYGGSRAISVPSLTLVAPSGGGADDFGASIAPAGDVNGDGYADVVIGDPGRTVANTVGYRGTVYLYFGGPNGLDPTPHPIDVDDPSGLVNELGRTLAGVGDVDGDGYGDIAISAGWSALPSTIRNDGALYLLHGGADGITGAPAIAHGGAFEALGQRLAGVDDATGDGVVDVAASTASGLSIYPGSAANGFGAPLPIVTAVVTAIGSPGDVDGDGHAEIVTGQACPPSSSSCTGPGAVRVFDGAAFSARQTFVEPAAMLESFGMAVGG